MIVRMSAKSTLTMPWWLIEVRHALHGLQEHLVGHPERLLHGGALGRHRHEALVRDGDQRVDHRP
jgi:hypothetical protein